MDSKYGRKILKEFLNTEKGVSSPQIIGEKVFFNIGDQIYSQGIKDTAKTKVTDFYSGVSGVEFSPSKNKIIFVPKFMPIVKTKLAIKLKMLKMLKAKLKPKYLPN